MATSPADDDDLLWEILLRLPPQASSLLRASAVCKRWRGLVTDPQFLRRFRVHHRKPPIIGFFEGSYRPVFRSIVDPPIRIPPPETVYTKSILLGCRHGRVLVNGARSKEFMVCDPITGQRSRVALPPEFKDCLTVNGAVLCAAAAADDDQGNHVHGSSSSSCHSSPFKMVLVSMEKSEDNPRLIACVYSSMTGVWSDLISTAVPILYIAINPFLPGVLAGKSLYWLLLSGDTVEFDLDRQSLTVIGKPPVPTSNWANQRVIQAEDHGSNIGHAILAYPSLQMWQRKVDCHGVSTWVLWKNIDLCSTFGFPPEVNDERERRDIILGYAEDAGVIFLHVAGSVYMVHLESMQARRLHDQGNYAMFCFPLTSFHTAAGSSDCSSLSQETCASRNSHWWWI